MPNGKERAATILRGPGGEEIYRQVVRYAEMQARIRGWRAGQTLPGNESPRSVAHTVVAKLLDPDGGRSWDEQKEPSLLNALKGMARSEIGHLYDRIEEQLVEPIGKVTPDGKERTDNSFASTDLHPDELDPERLLLRKERKNLEHAAMTLVLREVEGNEDLELVVLALDETNSPTEIASLTGLPAQRVYSARRELNRIVSRISLTRVVRTAREESEQ